MNSATKELCMKRVLFVFAMICVLGSLIALESAPSEVVGYVKYECVTGLSFIALPLDTGYSTSAELGNAISNANQISKWDAAGQEWYSSGKNMFNQWTNIFDLEPGMAIMVKTTSDVSFYVTGGLYDVNPIYTIQYVADGGNLNAVMIPLDRSDLTTSQLVGADMVEVNQISYWNETDKEWESSGKNMFNQWTNGFDTTIGMPLMIKSTAAFTWPGSSDKTTNRSKNKK